MPCPYFFDRVIQGMLIGYVSDELDSALSGVWVEIEGGGLRQSVRSGASGSIHADLPPGEYTVSLSHRGFGAKRSSLRIPDEAPKRFRLLSDSLLGYAWPKWVRAGESSEFRVHSPSAYKLGLWRYGWEKEFIRNLGWFDDHGPRATAQLLPDGDFVGSGVGWNRVGYGSRWHHQRVVAPERSGLYYFHAKTESGRFHGFPWIVEPAEPAAAIAVLTSNITWNAYNAFGGRSNYVNQDGLPDRPTLHARQELRRYTHPGTWPYDERSAAISFDRPEPFNALPENARITDPVEGRLESAMAPAEWRLLGWMEREEFDYDLYSETSLHFDRIPLESYKALVLNTHPEYWSKEMYRRVKRWVYESGGRLVYLGGCGMLAEVEFPDESTIVCRQEGRRDLRGESEANLLGVAYSHSGYQTGAPYRVLNDSHWVFEGTGLGVGELFGHASLHERCPGGASGHELDKVCDESPSGVRRLAKGMNPEDTGADMVMLETPSGGAVFSAGSLCWTLSIAVDEGVSNVTANVLGRFCR